jgi:ABC-type multidrug transport system ATPase subunit
LGCEWVDLSVSIRVKKRNKGERGVTMKQLVQPTSGYAQSGDLLAVMGPSGSGKTTLLDAIAGRMKSAAVGGSITFDGSVLTDSQHQAFVSYVAQEDSLLGVFTVSETLRMALRFRYGYNMKSEAELKSLESHALKLVGLTSAAGTKVGDIFRKGLSGGQKRRLSLAVELVKAPKVMVLDEPTSGLDSASAFGIMSSLTALAKLGHTVIATIHQPSSDVWTLFDKLLLLSEGRTLFFGESRAAVGYFGALGHQCPELSNPADFFLALINTDFPLHACDLGYLQRAYGKGAPAAAGSFPSRPVGCSRQHLRAVASSVGEYHRLAGLRHRLSLAQGGWRAGIGEQRDGDRGRWRSGEQGEGRGRGRSQGRRRRRRGHLYPRCGRHSARRSARGRDARASGASGTWHRGLPGRGGDASVPRGRASHAIAVRRAATVRAGAAQLGAFSSQPRDGAGGRRDWRWRWRWRC